MNTIHPAFRSFRALALVAGLASLGTVQAAEFPHPYAASSDINVLPLPSGWANAQFRNRAMSANGWMVSTVRRDSNDTLIGTIMRRNPLSGVWEDIEFPTDAGFNFKFDECDIRINNHGDVAITRDGNPFDLAAFYDGEAWLPVATTLTQAWQVERNGTRFLGGRDITGQIRPGYWLDGAFTDFYAKLGNEQGNVGAMLGTQMVTVSAVDVDLGPFTVRYTADYTVPVPVFVTALPNAGSFSVTQGALSSVDCSSWFDSHLTSAGNIIHFFKPDEDEEQFVTMFQTVANRGTTTMTHIPPLPGDTSLRPEGVTMAGVVLGGSWDHVADEESTAMLWTQAGGAIDVAGTLSAGNAWMAQSPAGIAEDGAIFAAGLIVPVPTVTLTGLDTEAAIATDAITLQVDRSGGSTLLPLEVTIRSSPTIFADTVITIPVGETSAIKVISLTSNRTGATNAFIVQAVATADAEAAYSRAGGVQSVAITAPAGNSDTKDWEYGIVQIANPVDLPNPGGWSGRTTRGSAMSHSGWWVAVMSEFGYGDHTDDTSFTLIRWDPSTRTWTDIGRPVDLPMDFNFENDHLDMVIAENGTVWLNLDQDPPLLSIAIKYDGTWTTPFGTTELSAVYGVEAGGDRLSGARLRTVGVDPTFEPVVFNYPTIGGEYRMLAEGDLTGMFGAAADHVLGTRVIGGFVETLAAFDNGPFPLFYVDLSDSDATRFTITPASLGTVTVDPFGPINPSEVGAEAITTAGFYFTVLEESDDQEIGAAFYHLGESGGSDTRIQPVLKRHSRVQIEGSTLAGVAVGTSQLDDNGQESSPFRWDPGLGVTVDLRNEVAPSHPAATFFNGTQGITESGIIGAWGGMMLVPVPDVTLGVTVGTATEAGSDASITLTRTGPTMFPLTVSLSASGATGDLTVPATAVIPAGQASVSVSLAAVNDGQIELDENVTVTIAKSSNGGDALLTYNILTTGNSGSITVSSEDVGVAVTVSTSGANPTNTTIPVTITFAQDVSGFVVGEISVSNGSAGTFNPVSGTVYTATVTPTADGAVTISIAGSVATATVGGTPNAASNNLVITYDITPPPVPTGLDLAVASDSGTSTSDDITNDTTPTISGSVTGDAVAVRLYEGATLRGTDSSIVAGAWSLDSSTIAGQGVHTFTARSVDALGNESADSATLSITLDTVAPTVTTGISPAVQAVATGFTGTITWSEPVSGFAVGDLTLTNATAAPLAGGPSIYTTDLTATAQGSLGFSIATSVVTDIAGNANATGAALTSATFTPAPVPTITLGGGATNPTNVAPIPVVVTFSETVNGFDSTDIVVAGGTLANFAVVTPNLVWSFDITGVGQGNRTVDIAAGMATATAGGLANVAATQFTVLYDSVAPSAPGLPDLVLASDSGSNTSDDLTNVTMATFTGTAEAGATVTLFDGLDQIGQGVATGVAWTITSTVNLAEGARSITASAVDPAGNASGLSSALTVTIDTTPAAVPTALDLDSLSDSGASATDNITNDTTPTISGSAPASTLVRLYSDGTQVGNATSDGAGAWSITPSALAQGARVLTARSEDAAGNLSAASASLTVTIDTTAPAAPTALDLAVGSDSGSSSTDDLTSDSTPTINGMSENNILVHLYADGTPVGSITSAGIWWSITASSLLDGARAMTARAEDTAGNQSAASATLTVTVDTIAAAVPSTPNLVAGSDSGSSTTDDVTNDTTPDINGTATAGILVRLYAGVTEVGSATATGGNWTITTTVLGNGAQSVTARSEDAAGNLSAASTALSVTIDNLTPAAPTGLDLDVASDSGSSSSDNITNDTTLTINGSGEVGASIQVLDGATPVGSTTIGGGGTWSVTTSALAAGARVLTATATDVAGNPSSASTALNVTIDTTPPAVPTALDLVVGSDSGSSSSDNLTNDATPTVSGSSDASVVVRLYADAVEVGSASANGAGVWSITATTLGSGARAITARAEDVAGNQTAASATLTVTIDTTADAVPSVPDLVAGSDSGSSATDNVTNDTTPDLSGTATAGTLVRLYAGVVEVGSATATGGTWTITATTLADGIHALTARSEDGAGNPSAASAAVNVTIDTGVPAAPTGLDLDVASDVGTSTSDDITNDTTLTINGSGEAGATVRVLDGVTQVASAVVGGGGTWSATTSVLASGARVLTATITDAAGNVSTASTSLTVTIDTTAPTLVLGAPSLPGGQTAVRVGQALTVVATYADEVGGSGMGAITLANGDLAFGGSSAGASAAVSGAGLATRTITVTVGTGAGSFTVGVGVAGTGQDVAGNPAPVSAASTAIALDNTLPTVVISTTAPATTANASIPVRLVFSEAVAGLVYGDLLLVNASAGATPLTSTNGGVTWNGSLIATASGAVQVGLSAAAVTDAVGNGNALVAATLLTTYDLTGPTVTVNQAASQVDPTSGDVTFTVTFSQAINPATFNATTDMIFGGTAGGARTATGSANPGNTVFTVTVSGMAAPAGTVTAVLPANVVLSVATAKPNQASTSADNSVSWTVPAGGGGSSGGSTNNGIGSSGGTACGSGSGFAGIGLLLVFLIGFRPHSRRRDG